MGLWNARLDLKSADFSAHFGNDLMSNDEKDWQFLSENAFEKKNKKCRLQKFYFSMCEMFCVQFQRLLTLFVTGGGALNAPTIKNRSAISPWAMLGSPKLLTLFLSVLDIFQQSRFSNFQFLKKISNVVKNIQRGDPSVNFKFLVFWLEILFFWWLETA